MTGLIHVGSPIMACSEQEQGSGQRIHQRDAPTQTIAWTWGQEGVLRRAFRMAIGMAIGVIVKVKIVWNERC